MLRAGSTAAGCSFSRSMSVTLPLLCPSCPHLQPAASSYIPHYQTYTEPFQLLSWEIIIITIPKHRGDLRAILQRHWQIHNFRRKLPSTSQPSCFPLPLTHCRLGCQLSAGITPMRQGKKKKKKNHRRGMEESPNLKRNSPLRLVLCMLQCISLQRTGLTKASVQRGKSVIRCRALICKAFLATSLTRAA